MDVGFMAMGQGLKAAVQNAKTLEAAGVPSVWIGESTTDTFVYATAVASATSQIRIGTAVALLTRPPAQAAMACAGIDEVSDGRFTFGIGVGPVNRNRDWFGLDTDRPVRRMREYIGCFKQAWHSTPEHPGRYDGEIFHMANFVRRYPPTTPNLPVLAGVVGPMNTRVGVEHGDGVIFNVALPQAYVASTGLGAVADGLANAGKDRRDITIGAVLGTSVDPDRKTAILRGRNLLLTYCAVDYFDRIFRDAGFGADIDAARAALDVQDTAAALEAISPEMVETMLMAGTPDEVRSRAAEWRELVDFAIVSTPWLHLDPDEAAWSYDQAVRCLAGWGG